MKRFLPLVFLIALLIGIGTSVWQKYSTVSGAPPYGEAEAQVPDEDPYAWLRNWVRPEGPAKVGLQVGHWKNDEVPEELERLRGNTGSSGGGKWEWEVNMAIAQATAEILTTKGVEVEILPATVPQAYWADVFVSVHADGSLDRSVSGFKVASPWRDWTGRASKLSDSIEVAYGEATGMTLDSNISRNMRGYYAFSYWRYDHAIHPMTTAAILETGFLTNASDRKIIVAQPELVAQGLAEGILEYLESENLLAD